MAWSQSQVNTQRRMGLKMAAAKRGRGRLVAWPATQGSRDRFAKGWKQQSRQGREKQGVQLPVQALGPWRLLAGTQDADVTWVGLTGGFWWEPAVSYQEDGWECVRVGDTAELADFAVR